MEASNAATITYPLDNEKGVDVLVKAVRTLRDKESQYAIRMHDRAALTL
jgi:hypothetical protein